MITQDQKTTIHTLEAQGICRNEIARLVGIDVKSVRKVLAAQAIPVDVPAMRVDKVTVDEKLLEELYRDCKGYKQRMHELLTEEHGIAIGYSSLTRLVREMGLGVHPKPKSCHVPDIPGEEMQHDTSEHIVMIGGHKRKVISSGLYLRYSKMRYVRFYRRFNRFTMKCFFDEALRHWGYCALTCIIDNTHLAILHGSGSKAVICSEMIGFAGNYGFAWKVHAIGHADRKAGTERNFYTVETNFIPGRIFASMEDMNTQSIHWSTVRYAKRPQAKTRLVPAMLFETEKSVLVKLPDYVSTPCLDHQRVVDQYGYISFDGNYYHVPESLKTRTVTVLQYAHTIGIMDGTTEVLRHQIAADGIKNERIVEPGHVPLPRYAPKNRKLGCEQEEKKLVEMREAFAQYLEQVKSPQSGVRHRPAFVRGLYALTRRMGASLIERALKRAQEYNVFDLCAIERIAVQFVELPVDTSDTFYDTDQDLETRSTYREGQYSEENPVDFT